MMRLHGNSKLTLVFRMIGSLVLQGCSGGPATNDPANEAPFGGEGEGEGDKPAAPVPAPAYECSSQFDVGAGLFLPETVDGALATLTGLGEHPGEAMLDLAETAGVPAVGEVRDALPFALEDELTGFIDDQLNAHETAGQASTADRIAGLSAEIRGSLATFELQTTLEVPAGGVGQGHHRVEAIVLSPLSEDPILVPAEIVALAGEDDVVVSIERSSTGDTAELALGEHAFGLPAGEIALAGIDQLLERTAGVPDLRAAIGAIVDCDAVAEAVAEQCVAFVCVGHEADLRAICEGALDQATAEIEAQFAALDFNAVHLLSGAATLVAGENGRYDAITDGVWDARLNAGMGERESRATFACSAR